VSSALLIEAARVNIRADNTPSFFMILMDTIRSSQ
jgi:hypothetical protein